MIAAVLVPFAARAFVAWTVWGRVHAWLGLFSWPSANIEPRRQTSDYPAPNDPVMAIVVMIGAGGVAVLIASMLGPLLSSLNAPSWLWSGCYVVSLIACLVYVFRRIHADDVRTLKILHQRLIAQAESKADQP